MIQGKTEIHKTDFYKVLTFQTHFKNAAFQSQQKSHSSESTENRYDGRTLAKGQKGDVGTTEKRMLRYDRIVESRQLRCSD